MNEATQAKLQHYRGMLAINKHRLDDALECQAEVQEQISDTVAEMSARMLELKEELGKTEARLIEDFRQEERSTKDAVDAKVRRHPERVRAWERYQQALGDLARWDGLLDAWKGRGKDLQALGRLFGDQYFSLTQTSVSRHERRAERPTREGRPDYSQAEPSRARRTALED